MQNYTLAVEQSRLVFVKCEFPGGTITLKKEDLGLKVIPKGFKLGSKEIIDVAMLKTFRTLRSQIYDFGKSQGTMFCEGVYIMKQEQAELFVDFVKNQFEIIRVEMETFLLSYKKMVADWAAQFPPEVAMKVINEAPSVEQVRAKFLQYYVCTAISEPGGKLGDGGLKAKMSNVPLTALSEIAADVHTTWFGKNPGKTAVKSLLDRITTKLEPLSFLTDGFSEIIKTCNDVSNELTELTENAPAGQKTKIPLGISMAVNGLLQTFLDPEKVYDQIKNGGFAIQDDQPIVLTAPVIDTPSMTVEVVEVVEAQPSAASAIAAPADADAADAADAAAAPAAADAAAIPTIAAIQTLPQALTFEQARNSFLF